MSRSAGSSRAQTRSASAPRSQRAASERAAPASVRSVAYSGRARTAAKRSRRRRCLRAAPTGSDPLVRFADLPRRRPAAAVLEIPATSQAYVRRARTASTRRAESSVPALGGVEHDLGGHRRHRPALELGREHDHRLRALDRVERADVPDRGARAPGSTRPAPSGAGSPHRRCDGTPRPTASLERSSRLPRGPAICVTRMNAVTPAADLLRVDGGLVAGDHAAGLELLHALVHRRGRQPHVLRDLRERRLAPRPGARPMIARSMSFSSFTSVVIRAPYAGYPRRQTTPGGRHAGVARIRARGGDRRHASGWEVRDGALQKSFTAATSTGRWRS